MRLVSGTLAALRRHSVTCCVRQCPAEPRAVSRYDQSEQFEAASRRKSRMAYWLFKEEPDHYSLENLFRDKRAAWDGVENNLALKHLRSVKKADHVLYYHTGKEKAVVGVMEVVKGEYPDPAHDDARFVIVDVRPLRRFDRPVSLAEIKQNSTFVDFALVRISRLSVMPVTDKQWAEIERLSKQGS